MAPTGTGLIDFIDRARGFLREQGVQPGDRVAILGPNSVRWVAADLGALANGAIVVPLYDRQAPAELSAMLRSAQPKALLAASSELLEGVNQHWDGNDCVCATFDEVFTHAGIDEPIHEFGDSDTIALIYTSGTSGEPKGVMLTRSNLDFMIPRTIERLAQVVKAKKTSDRVFHYLPFCFAASRLMLWTQLSRPNPLMMSTDLGKLVVEIATAKPNYFLNVPAVLERIRSGVGAKIEERGGIARSLYDRGQEAFRASADDRAGLLDRAQLAIARQVVFSKIKQQIGADLEFLISGSAPLSEETQRWFQMLGIPVYQAYGLTETTGIVTLDEPNKTIAGRVGTVIKDVDVKVSEEGELLVRGPNLFTGYWNRPEDTKAAIIDGWFHTGDQVELDAGSLKILGRIKNLIIPESGHNVAPEPLEAKFRELCPGAEHCVVVGHGQPFLIAIVTGNPPQNNVDEALEQLNSELPFYKRIRKALLVEEPFTPESGLLTANQKLRRAAIEDHFSDRISAAYKAVQAERSAKAGSREASRSS